MTVAIACEFQDGVLFCADTKLTTGEEKAHASKLYARQWGKNNNGLTVFAISGDVDYAAAAIEKCERALGRLDFLQTSLDEMQEVIENVLSAFHSMHVFPHPDRSQVEFFLLIGLWLNGSTRILSTHDAALRTVHGYQCVGSGGYLARYWLQQALGSVGTFDPEKLTLEEASLIVEHAINSAAEYDEYCGGEIEYVGMRFNGEITEIGDVREGAYLGSFPEALNRESWALLRRLAQSKEAWEQEIAVDDFTMHVKELHKPVVAMLEHFKEAKAEHEAKKRALAEAEPNGKGDESS